MRGERDRQRKKGNKEKGEDRKGDRVIGIVGDSQRMTEGRREKGESEKRKKE